MKFHNERRLRWQQNVSIAARQVSAQLAALGIRMAAMNIPAWIQNIAYSVTQQATALPVWPDIQRGATNMAAMVITAYIAAPQALVQPACRATPINVTKDKS